jgi:hypothetical protein
MEDAHHFNEIVIGMHWQVNVEDGVGRDTPERRLDAPLDLLIKPPITSTVPSRGALGTISSKRRARRISGSTFRSKPSSDSLIRKVCQKDVRCSSKNF